MILKWISIGNCNLIDSSEEGWNWMYVIIISWFIGSLSFLQGHLLCSSQHFAIHSLITPPPISQKYWHLSTSSKPMPTLFAEKNADLFTWRIKSLHFSNFKPDVAIQESMCTTLISCNCINQKCKSKLIYKLINNLDLCMPTDRPMCCHNKSTFVTQHY